MQLILATLEDYPTIQNMARFYVYDMSRYCGLESKNWSCPSDGLYESYDFKSYFNSPDKKGFLVKIKEELAGFVLINKTGTTSPIDWNMGEFFILARYQGKGISEQVAQYIWQTHPGRWELSVLPDNVRALHFWRKAIRNYIGNYKEQLCKVEYDLEVPQRYILTFDSQSSRSSATTYA